MSDRADKLQAKHFGFDQPMSLTINSVGNETLWVTSGQSQYGDWWMYDVTLNGVKRAFFPSEGLQKAIMDCHRETPLGVGTELSICKHERADGGEGIWWAVGIAGTAAEPPGALPQSAPPPPTPRQTEAKFDKLGGIERMAHHAMEIANKQLTHFAIEFSAEDLRGWASTILIAYQKAGIGPQDFPDIRM